MSKIKFVVFCIVFVSMMGFNQQPGGCNAPPPPALPGYTGPCTAIVHIVLTPPDK